MPRSYTKITLKLESEEKRKEKWRKNFPQLSAFLLCTSHHATFFFFLLYQPSSYKKSNFFHHFFFCL
uniref:Uncharacterized protein n=1 Tax=Rhizophora mucronata TaxID=61149 RepID=A0A2P2QZP1_RHIMU